MKEESDFPLDGNFIDQVVALEGLDLVRIGIRELKALVDELSMRFEIDFLRFEFGIPGIPASTKGQEAEKAAFREEGAPSVYPDFDGLPVLKEAAARFFHMFCGIELSPRCCVPTVGAMQGCFTAMSVAGRFREANTILFLDPGFPVNKHQARFLGLGQESIDFFDHRGEALLEAVESRLETGKVGGVLWSSPNNPTWICLTRKELAGLGRLLTKYDAIAIEDMAYFGMDFREDYSVPGQPPYQPTIAEYTDNYFIILSSSKIFSYAGQRVGVTFISPELLERRSEHLEGWFPTDKIGQAFALGGVHVTSAGVTRSAQEGLAALLDAASDGELDFLGRVREYAGRARRMKEIFLGHGFHLVYDNDLGEPLSDGFYFTIGRQSMDSGDLVKAMLCFGMSGIPLRPTGSSQEGLRICTSTTDPVKFGELERRVAAMDRYLRASRT